MVFNSIALWSYCNARQAFVDLVIWWNMMELSLAASRYCGSKSGRSVTVWKNDFESMLFIHPCHVATHEGTFFSERLMRRLQSVSCSRRLEPLEYILRFSKRTIINHNFSMMFIYKDLILPFYSRWFGKNMDLIINIDMPRTSIDFLSRFWGLERGWVLEVLPPLAASDATSVGHQGLGRHSWSPPVEGSPSRDGFFLEHVSDWEKIHVIFGNMSISVWGSKGMDF